MSRRTVAERFWSKVDRSAGSDGCWPWLTGRQGGGYGDFSIGRQHRLAHRLAYELLVGPIPAGLQIDHLCRNRACVNPSHMEPVTARENILRGTNHVAQYARQTHCKRGHAFTVENTIKRPGGRECRTCNRAQTRQWVQRRRLARQMAAS